VHGPFYLSQICLRDDMGPAKSGRIINISSSAAIGPGFVGLGPAHEDETCYGACKAAVERMTQGLAAEVSADKYEGGIAVSCYAPSEVVYTPGVVHNNRGSGQDDGEPVETMARAALLLATEPVARVNGAVTYSQRVLRDFGWEVKHTGAELGGAGISDRPITGYAERSIAKM